MSRAGGENVTRDAKRHKRSNSVDEGSEDVTTTAIYHPAGQNKEEKALPCSASSDFCFFCEFEGNPNAIGTDTNLYGNLVDLANHLGSMHREASAIANHLYDVYSGTIQMHIEDQPIWSRESIVRHLMNSGQFKEVFDTSVNHMFTSLIARQNAELCDASTGQVIEDNRRAFCDTVKTMVTWRNHTSKKNK